MNGRDGRVLHVRIFHVRGRNLHGRRVNGRGRDGDGRRVCQGFRDIYPTQITRR